MWLSARNYRELMPYIVSPLIHIELPGLWGEGHPYEKETVYDINSTDPASPPVHYDAHTLKPHSVTHIDFPGHITSGTETAESYFEGDARKCFYGKCLVLKLQDIEGEALDNGITRFTVTPEAIKENLLRVTASETLPEKLFITLADCPYTEDGFQDANSVLILNEESAELLMSNPEFNAFGTTWKSSDFMPGSRERPIHKILLRQAVLFECLNLQNVPEGEYFLSGFPLRLDGATESPATVVLYDYRELGG